MVPDARLSEIFKISIMPGENNFVPIYHIYLIFTNGQLPMASKLHYKNQSST